MTNSQHTVWIDITDISLWTSHLTGTQRVVYEVGRRFYERDQMVKFFVYDEKTLAFYESSFEDVQRKMEQFAHSTEETVGADAFKTSPRHFLLRSYHSLPYSIRSRVTPEHKTAAKKAYRGLRSLKAAVLARRPAPIKQAVKKSKSITFNQDDVVVILGKPWDTMSFVEALRRQKIDQHFKLVHLIYDMIPCFMPHLFGQPLPDNYTKYMFEAISLSDHLVAISRSTKKDVKRFCEQQLIPTPKISVTRLGDNFIDEEASPAEPIADYADRDFILCVGTLEVRKNHILLYTTYKEGLLRGLKLPAMVIVGGTGWYTGDVLYQFQHDPQIKDLVKVMPKVSDEQLDWLYRNCLFTIYPSVYEGWGLPIAESLAYGKVCISSNASSMPEIAGGLIDYFSPFNSQQCLELIEKYLNPGVLAQKQRQIGEVYRPTSWDQTYSQVAGLVDKVGA